MRKKESWMCKGATVLAHGKKGTITQMQENTLGGVDYVYYIEVRLDGEKHAGTYHPGDVQAFTESFGKSSSVVTPHGMLMEKGGAA